MGGPARVGHSEKTHTNTSDQPQLLCPSHSDSVLCGELRRALTRAFAATAELCKLMCLCDIHFTRIENIYMYCACMRYITIHPHMCLHIDDDI